MKQPTILVVEDEPWLGEAYVNAIKTAGFEAVYVADAAQAIDAVDSHKPDLILLDIMLPGANGLQLIHELRSHTDLKSLPVVICSNASSHTSSEQLRTHYGVKAILDKPRLTPFKLIEAILGALK